MRIQRVQAKQGHPVPSRGGYAMGPFPPDLLATAEVVVDYTPQDDSGGAEIPRGGTAQNGFRPKRYQCRDCGEILLKHELEDHDCDYEDEEDEEDFDE